MHLIACISLSMYFGSFSRNIRISPANTKTFSSFPFLYFEFICLFWLYLLVILEQLNNSVDNACCCLSGNTFHVSCIKRKLAKMEIFCKIKDISIYSFFTECLTRIFPNVFQLWKQSFDYLPSSQLIQLILLTYFPV